jgi:hypothetical protein
MADRKYQPIFDPKTQVIVGDKVKEGGGTALRKMMTDLLAVFKLKLIIQF